MEHSIVVVTLIMSLLPLLGALFAGLSNHLIAKTTTHRVVISLIFAAFLLSLYLCKVFLMSDQQKLEPVFYTWGTAGTFQFDIAFLIDRLSVLMCTVVLFVSLMVHIYTIGYMKDDPGYQRFFSYVSLFTFAMLMLVLANNFLLLFFGWEGVGLVSYLLIGFWFEKESANVGSLKAFIVNRVGDVAFIIAIAAVLTHAGSLNYAAAFSHAADFANSTITLFPDVKVSLVNFVCAFLFIGAMAKSAQVPLHVWLPESMEGPTPISALIHAATMVTAGIYMVARMSPLFEYSETILNIILILGGTTAFFMGLLALTQFDIKRVIAYSTISQLGYMAVALGASAYDAAIFHLITHAFFKALLFLAAGSVIIALHHEQDMRKMGGLVAYLPVTYLTFMVGALALSAVPPFSGFYSKDLIIELVSLSHLPAAKYAYYCVLGGAFVTPLYIFRALFLTFHTKERMSADIKAHLQESPWVVLIPLVLLAVPSLIAGQLLVLPMIFSSTPLLQGSTFVLPDHQVINQLSSEFQNAKDMALNAGHTLTFWITLLGIFTAWWFIVFKPEWTEYLKTRFRVVYQILVNKYGFDAFYQRFFVKGTQRTGHLFYDVSDVKLIDGFFVNGSGRFIQWLARTTRRLQTGYIYHYALVMTLGLVACLIWYVGGMHHA